MMKSDKQVVEYIPMKDYFHRHSRSIFWELQVRLQITKQRRLHSSYCHKITDRNFCTGHRSLRQQRRLPLPVRMVDASEGLTAKNHSNRCDQEIVRRKSHHPGFTHTDKQNGAMSA